MADNARVRAVQAEIWSEVLVSTPTARLHYFRRVRQAVKQGGQPGSAA